MAFKKKEQYILHKATIGDINIYFLKMLLNKNNNKEMKMLSASLYAFKIS